MSPGTRITRRWLPTLVVAARLTYRTIPVVWPVTVTSREIAPLLGLTGGPMALPGVPTGSAPALPPSPIMPDTGLIIGRANYPGLDRLLCLNREDRLRHLWIAGRGCCICGGRGWAGCADALWPSSSPVTAVRVRGLPLPSGRDHGRGGGTCATTCPIATSRSC